MTAITDDRGGSGYRGNAGKHTHARAFALLQGLLPSGRVLDVPCGEGSFTRRLVEAGYDVVAGDIERDPKLPAVEYSRVDMNRPLELDDASVNAVVSIEGIEHLERQFDFIRECRRVLRRDGALIITTPNISSARSRWRWLLTGFHNKCKFPLDETNPEPRHHISMISFPELRYMLHSNGFRISQVTTNRIKGISWLYVPLIPIQHVMCRWVFSRAKARDINADVNRSVLEQMMTLDVQLGETLIVSARAVEDGAPG